MIKNLFICHGNQVRESNLQIILDYPAFIEYLASLVLQPLLLSDNGQRKSDQLFTVGRLLSAYSFFKSTYVSQNCCLSVIFD